MTDLPGQGMLFGPSSARQQYDASPVAKGKARQANQCELILARLRQGPATNHELAGLSLKYTSRISDLRKQGHAIEVFDVDHASGRASYRLV